MRSIVWRSSGHTAERTDSSFLYDHQAARRALLAKGRIAGIQFGELFTDGLYLRIGKPAMEAAEQIKDALKKYGYQLSLDTPTNQIFCIVSNEVMKKIAQDVEFGFWEKYDETHSVIRFATSWATTMEDTQKLIQILEKNK